MTLRNRHRRADDHTTPQPLSSLVLEADIVGRYATLPTYPAGMRVVDMLADIASRMGVVGALHGFTANAVFTILGEDGIYASAVKRKTLTGSLTANAKVV